MTRKQRMYPESNRVKMSLCQDKIVEDIHRNTRKVFVKKAGKRDYSDTEYDDRRFYGETAKYNQNVMDTEKNRCISANAFENLQTPKAEKLDEGQLYEWSTKQLILQYGSACNGCE